jgi:hypothetical protein
MGAPLRENRDIPEDQKTIGRILIGKDPIWRVLQLRGKVNKRTMDTMGQ